MTNVPYPPQNQSINKAPTGNILLAGFWIRMLAMLMDISILTPIVLLVVGFISILNEPTPISFLGGSPVKPFDNTIIIGFVVIISLLYFVLFTAFFGATVGKMLLELKVRRPDLSKVSFPRILLRETIGKLISGILFIGYIAVAFRKDKKGFHDLIADTVVVRLSPPRKHETILLVFLTVVVILLILLPIFIFIFESLLISSIFRSSPNI